MADYIDKDGSLKETVNSLTLERNKELISHLLRCEVSLQECTECWELYSSVGHDAYVILLTSDM